jgi:uroporphyrinogen-III synthase
MSSDDIDQITEQRRTDHGVSITTKLTRGDGTRDQDKHTIKAKGATFAEAQHYHRKALEYLTGDYPADDADDSIVEQIRDAQPGDDDG